MSLTVIVPPAEPAVTLAEAKAFLRIADDGEDSLVSDLVDAATRQVELATGRVLVSRELEACWQAWPSGLSGRGVKLQPGPLISLSSVRIETEAGESEDLTSRFVLECGRLRLRDWSIAPPIQSGERVLIRFIAGYGAQADVPGDLGLAIRRLVQSAYSVGELSVSATRGMPDDVEAVLSRYREVRL